jgi:hypothetical protein
MEASNKRKMIFSDASLRKWSSLFLWNNSSILSNLLPPISDGLLTVKMMKIDTLTFMVSTKTTFEHDVGEYVSTHSRMTTDPVELKKLLSSTLAGRELYKDLALLFPPEALVRLQEAESMAESM